MLFVPPIRPRQESADYRRRFDRMSSVTLTSPPLPGSLADDALINQFGLADTVVDADAIANSVQRFREQGITLPTFAQLADPSSVDPAMTAGVGKNDAHAANLWRVHWYNDLAGNR